jgi:hypothetical protein
MEKRHQEQVAARFGDELAGKRVVCLHIPDDYAYGDESCWTSSKPGSSRSRGHATDRQSRRRGDRLCPRISMPVAPDRSSTVAPSRLRRVRWEQHDRWLLSRRASLGRGLPTMSPLAEIIGDEIAASGGRIPFARFMEVALYDPDARLLPRARAAAGSRWRLPDRARGQRLLRPDPRPAGRRVLGANRAAGSARHPRVRRRGPASSPTTSWPVSRRSRGAVRGRSLPDGRAEPAPAR